MGRETQLMIDTAVAHLGRFAFFTRDNPFASVRAGDRFRRGHRAALTALLEGDLTVDEWLTSPLARSLLDQITVGCLPRDLQLTGDRSVAVTSVHAFIHAPFFWWVASVLWCMTVGRSVDPLLDKAVMGYRLHPEFLEEPGKSGLMFRDPAASHAAWRRRVTTASSEMPGQVLAANTVDVAAFYYSVTTGPAAITAEFDALTGPRGLDGAGQVLTALLDALHRAYAVRAAAVRPRGVTDENRQVTPLPVGLPSSRILANMIVSFATWDLHELDPIVALAAYADDFVALTPVLPTPLEPIKEYFQRLEILDTEGRLRCPRARAHAILEVNIEKSASSYSRGISAATTEEDQTSEGLSEAREVGQIDPYLEVEPSAEWGGALRTVLRAPQRREREPRKLERHLEALVGEIGVGLDPATIGARLEQLLLGLDTSLFLRLRRYWADLAVASVTAGGHAGLLSICRDFVAATDSLELPADAPEEQRDALLAGLRASWIQALAVALAVAMSEAERAELAVGVPLLVGDAAVDPVPTADVTAYAARIRRRGLVPAQFVSVPLSELTRWHGRLIGNGVFAAFVSWAKEQSTDLFDAIIARVPSVVRFVPLHEACLAVHLWARPKSPKWLDEAIAIVRSQPLVNDAHIADLRVTAEAAVEPSDAVLPDADDDRGRLRLRFAMPSFRVRADQLTAILEGDTQAQASIISDSRTSTQRTVGTAVKRRADVLVLPEWAVLPEQLGWVMGQSSKSDMLIVAGQAPTVASNEYSNCLWTGIPVKDPAGRRACLVPPPREKRYLSPHEQGPLKAAGVNHALGGDTPIYRWRGMGVASLLCFEFADVSTRTYLRESVDLLTVSSWNRDWRYFDAIQESTTRDNYCVTFCVNTSDFPGTKIMRPTRNEMAVAASVHGSDYPAVVLRVLDLLPVVAARACKRRPSEVLTDPPADDTTLVDYKPVPPVW